MPQSSVSVTITVANGLSLRALPVVTFLPAVSTSQPHLGQMQPPSIQWRFVFFNGDINMGSRRPQSGQGFGRRKNSNITKKGIKGPIPIRIEEKELFISDSHSLFGNINSFFTDAAIIANKCV